MLIIVLVSSNITQDCLIGVDFLAKHNCLVDFKIGSVKAGKNILMGCRQEGMET